MAAFVAEHLRFEPAEIESSIVARFQLVVSQFPEQIAVTNFDGRRYTFADLDRASNGLAHALVDALGPLNCPIILLLEHSYPLLVTIMGALKAAKAYVALGPTLNEAQLTQLYQATGATAIVTDRKHSALAQLLASTRHDDTVPPAQIWYLEDLSMCAESGPAIPIKGSDMAAIYFTSGTVKQPRGVARSHRDILHRIWCGPGVGTLGPGDAISGIRQCGLSSSIPDIFSALLYGATYCLYDLHHRGLQGLSAWLHDERITYFHPPVVLFREWLQSLTANAYFPNLRYVLPSGRKTKADLEALWPHVSDECVVLTSYAATEVGQITLTPLYRTTPLEGDVLHVGAPLPGKYVTVVRDGGQSANIGEIGEITVRSRYIPVGYWREPALTAERFKPTDDGSGETIYCTGDFGIMRSDGYLQLVRRQDTQIKLRGYRIVLEEVEDALRSLPGVREAAVTFNPEREQMYAYIVSIDRLPSSPGSLRSALAEKLPSYALPNRFIILSEFPLLASGKVDYRALPPPGRARRKIGIPFIAPRSDLEQQIADIWAELLEMDEVGAEDNFFDLGGDSILAMRMALAVEKATGGHVPPEFFRTATVVHLAALLAQSAGVRLPLENDTDSLRPTGSLSKHARSIRHKLRKQATEIGPLWRGYGFSYNLGVRLQRLLVAQPFVRHRYAKQLALVERWAEELGLEGDGEERTTISLLANTWLIWRKHVLSHAANLGRWWYLSDPHHVLSGGGLSPQGIVLTVPHVGKIGAILLEFFRRNGREISQVTGGQWTGQKIRAEMLLQGERILQRGGVVMVPADGLQGSQTVDAPFWGRRRPWQIGAAELAVTTGAAFVPAYIHIDAQGHIHVEISAPLIAQSATPQDRIRELTQRYGADYAARWPQFYPSMRWHHLAYNLDLQRYE